MARRNPPRKVTYFEPVPPRLARNTIIESTFDVGRRFRCTMRVDCGQLDPGAVIQPIRGEWQPRMPERLDEEELADWRAGRDAVYQLAALDDRRAPRGRRRIEQEIRRACAGSAIVLRFRHGAIGSAPAQRRGPFAAMDTSATHTACRHGAGRSRLAARNQIRRLPHACAPRPRRGEAAHPHRARLDA